MTSVKKIEIKPIETGPADSQFELILYDSSKVLLVNMIPREQSDETGQDSEPFLAVHSDCQLMVGAAYTFAQDPPSPGISPLYLSTDGGWSWVRHFKIPANPSNQSYCFSGTGNRLYGAVTLRPDYALSVLETEDPTGSGQMRVISALSSGEKQLADDPFIQARRFNQDRIYVGQNYFGPELGGGKTASVRLSTDGGKTFRLLGVEARPTMGQDAPSVRPSIAKDGTVYVAFMRWTSSSDRLALQFKGDVVVTRDDEGGIGSAPFHSLTDPSDGKPGRIVAQNRVFPFHAQLGQQRIGSGLSLAVDPNNSATVYIAWADLDPPNKTYTIHLRKSTDRGRNWSEDLLAIPSATNPAVAVSDEGTVGFLYQQLRGESKSQRRWETHFQSSSYEFSSWTDIALANFPTNKEPKAEYQPYLGDKIHLMSVANDFYGVFSAPNIPERKYFPQGVHFQRSYQNGKLLSNDGKSKVPNSIDPYFFRISFESDSTISRRVDRLLAEIKGPALANYTGFVTAMFFDQEGRRIQEIGLGQQCDLRVQFVQRKPKESWAERIDIRGGEDAPQVAFKISVDGGDIEVTPDSRTVDVVLKGSAEARFTVIASSDVGSHSLFIQIFQKTRLIQVVAPTLTVHDRREG